ncbi:dihydrofolate reductase family protein [Streptomyces sp. PsTaAH-124]|uniref:dihydrofolate reductase family protein n=1 Tax=Streptomyces sp. PsTaAH-124 TaxID=1157638 RepID=UPI0003641257|nr:dihydrofolate reductase family protein [Streptomyces sp. PsTaAH-124]
MRKPIYGMNLSLDGYIAAACDDIGWSGPPSDELFRWWLDHERASGLRLFTEDAVAEITRLTAEDGGPMDIGGATLAGAALRAGLIDEYVIATHPVLVGGGTSFFAALDSWVNLDLVETRTFPGGVVLTRYGTRH